MAYQSYENLEVWKKAVDLTVNIYEVMKECRDYGLKDQMCRSAVSVPSNIAEGIERDSPKESVRFLHVAKGSCAELRTQLLIAERVGYLTKSKYSLLRDDAETISRMLHGLVKSLASEPQSLKPKT